MTTAPSDKDQALAAAIARAELARIQVRKRDLRKELDREVRESKQRKEL